jgi:fumarate reductase flavoprotein subunit
MRHLGEKVIDERLPFVRELATSYLNTDPVTQAVPVRPVVHYMMGGIHTDMNGATPIAGLFAAGEAACVSINGANRLGSNSLTELLVFGARAGRAAAEFASMAKDNGSTVAAQTADEQRRLDDSYRRRQGVRERLSTLRVEMQKTMEGSAGIYRTGDALAKGADTLRELQERSCRVALDDHSRTFNTERTTALEFSFMLDVAQAIIASALRRQESRGAHQRTDFPKRDDQHFLAHSLACRADDGTCQIDYKPVAITRWPPAERVYGR